MPTPPAGGLPFIPAAARSQWRWYGILGACSVMALVSAVFLLVGEFGGWYNDYQYEEMRYDYDEGRSRPYPVHRETWDSDGLFTDAGLAFPLVVALAGFVVAIGFLVHLLFRPTGRVRTRLLAALLCATASSLTISISAATWAANVSGSTEWWLAEAFYAPVINGWLVVAALAVLVAAKGLWPETARTDV